MRPARPSRLRTCWRKRSWACRRLRPPPWPRRSAFGLDPLRHHISHRLEGRRPGGRPPLAGATARSCSAEDRPRLCPRSRAAPRPERDTPRFVGAPVAPDAAPGRGRRRRRFLPRIAARDSTATGAGILGRTRGADEAASAGGTPTSTSTSRRSPDDELCTRAETPPQAPPPRGAGRRASRSRRSRTAAGLEPAASGEVPDGRGARSPGATRSAATGRSRGSTSGVDVCIVDFGVEEAGSSRSSASSRAPEAVTHDGDEIAIVDDDLGGVLRAPGAYARGSCGSVAHRVPAPRRPRPRRRSDQGRTLILAGLRQAPIESGRPVINLSLYDDEERRLRESLHELADVAYYDRSVIIASAHRSMPVDSYPLALSSSHTRWAATRGEPTRSPRGYAEPEPRPSSSSRAASTWTSRGPAAAPCGAAGDGLPAPAHRRRRGAGAREAPGADAISS